MAKRYVKSGKRVVVGWVRVGMIYKPVYASEG